MESRSCGEKSSESGTERCSYCRNAADARPRIRISPGSHWPQALSKPAGRNTRASRVFLDVGDRLVVDLDLFLKAGELRSNLLTLVGERLFLSGIVVVE